MKKQQLQIPYTEYDSEKDLPPAEAALLDAARKASLHAYAPYSGFSVGAAVRLAGGITVTGNNQENAAYPSGLCAERVALFAASSQYPGIAVEAIAITAHSVNISVAGPVSPCGACRQVMAEYETLHQKPMQIILAGESGKIIVLDNVNGVLPFKFDASQMGKK